MKVFTVLLVSLATVSSVIVGGGSPNLIQFQLLTFNGPRSCQGTIIEPGWVMSSAQCTKDTLTGTAYGGLNGTFLKTFVAPSFIDHPDFDVSLIYLGSDIASTNISYPTFVTDTIEEGQMGIVESVYPGYMDSVNVTFRGYDYCNQFIGNYSSSMFCTDKCVSSPGASVRAGNRIVGVVSWDQSQSPPENTVPCVYARVSNYISWIRAKTGA